MKHILLLVAILAGACMSAHAKIWRVNNNNGVAANFTTLQAAHDGAASGDTLHIEASPESYGDLSISKKLTIIGVGYFLDFNPNLQAVTQTSKVRNITCYNGSGGSTFIGLDFDGSAIAIYANNISIKRNKFSQVNQTTLDYINGTVYIYYSNDDPNSPVTGTVISQNFGLAISANNYPLTNLLVTNNYLTISQYYGDEITSSIISLHPNSVALIQNNIFRRGKVSVSNSTITNNILYAGYVEGSDNLIANNLASGSQFGTENGNKANVNMSTVFEATEKGDGYWKLKTGSPAMGAGYGSTAQNPIDCGMFSGHSAYVLSGIPPIPSIYFFTNQPVGSSSDPIDVTIKVRSNN